MQRQAQSPLLTLPHELFLRVLHFIEPPTHLDIACTCKNLLNSSQETLTRHREATEKYKSCSDKEGSLFPSLCRDVATDSFLTWHIRSFDSWGTRTLVGDEHDCKQEFRYCMKIIENDLTGSSELFGKLYDQMQDINSDAFLKFIIWIACDRLTSLRILHKEPSYDDKEQDEDASLTSLCLMVSGIRQSGLPWPPGLQSLTKVAIGVSLPQYGNKAYTRSPRALAAILRLPNAQSVYFRGLKLPDDDDRNGDRWIMEFASASNKVKDFYLDDPTNFSYDLRRGLFESFRELKSLTIRGGDLIRNGEQFDDCDMILGFLQDANKDCLENFIFYNTTNFHGYRCTMYRNEEFSRYTNLKMLTIDVNDILLDAYYNEPEYESSQARPEGHIYVTNHDFFVQWIVTAFPTSMEVLHLQCMSAISEADADYIDDGLAAMFESGNFKALKAVFLDHVEGASDWRGIRTATKVWFQKTMVAGRQHRVDVHTKTSRQRDMLHDIQFPMAADAEEEKAVFEGGSTFNAYSGHWEAQGCDNCGHCGVCQEIYPAALRATSSASIVE